jgi:hypothetical protein
MPRIREAITPPQAGSSISDPGIAGGAPAPAAPIPAATEAEGMMGSPASQGAANYLTGGMVELDPGPPSSQASGEAAWGGGGRGLVTPIPGPIGGDASLRSELEECYHMPSGSDPPAPYVARGGDQTPGGAPTTPGAATTPSASPATPSANVTTGPKGDAYVVRGTTDAQRAPRAVWAVPKGDASRFV